MVLVESSSPLSYSMCMGSILKKGGFFLLFQGNCYFFSIVINVSGAYRVSNKDPGGIVLSLERERCTSQHLSLL